MNEFKCLFLWILKKKNFENFFNVNNFGNFKNFFLLTSKPITRFHYTGPLLLHYFSELSFQISQKIFKKKFLEASNHSGFVSH